MIESIYIIDTGSGIPLFSHDLVEIQADKPLDKEIFSGFLKVLDDFSQETRSENINEVILANSRLVYETLRINERGLLFVSIDDLKEKSKRIRSTLQKIAIEFQNKYADEVKTFAGNIEAFKPFKEEVQAIITLELGTFKEKMELKRQEHPLNGFTLKLKEKHLEYMAKFKQKHSEKMAEFKKKFSSKKFSKNEEIG